MSIVVESTATAADSSTTTLTITKPPDLEEGDLMVSVLSGAEADGGGIGTWATLSGWSLAQSNAFGGAVAESVQYKIADSGDVAASNFTFTISATTQTVNGAILRCSGAAIGVAVTDALADSSTYSNTTANSATFAGTHSAFTPGADGALVIAMYGVEFSSGSSARTFGSYTVTSGVTLTELYDSGTNDGSGGAYYSAAYGVQATATELSAYGATISVSSDDHYGTFVIFTAPVDQTATTSLLETDTQVFTGAATADTVASTTLLETTAQVFSATAKDESPTQYSNVTKNSSNWTNQSKS